MRTSSKKVIAVVGPTCSGKTALAIELAKALDGEIIACDSRTVYREFDIGTAKPSPEERGEIPHHLIDVVDPTEEYTAARFGTEGKATIEDIQSRGKLAIVCGGTGFYARALLEGLEIPSVPPQQELREELRAYAEAHGNEALHARLNEMDPVSASRLNINDVFRIVRAIEVTTVTGTPFSTAATKSTPPFDTIWIGLNAEDRAYLHMVIERRMEIQMKSGLLEEVEQLYTKYGAHQKMMHTVNYRQLVQHLEGKLDLKQAVLEAIRHNNQLARRQLIWFRANSNINWFAIDKIAPREMASRVEEHVRKRL